MGIENWGGTEMIQWISPVVDIPVHEVKVLRDMDPCPCATMYISFDNEEPTLKAWDAVNGFQVDALHTLDAIRATRYSGYDFRQEQAKMLLH